MEDVRAGKERSQLQAKNNVEFEINVGLPPSICKHVLNPELKRGKGPDCAAHCGVWALACRQRTPFSEHSYSASFEQFIQNGCPGQ